MFTTSWQRPLILAAASLALVTGTACAAQASEPHAPTGISSSTLGDHPEPCTMIGKGGEGGEGGKGGKGGQPGEPGKPGKPGSAGCLRFDDLPDKPKSELSLVDKVHIVMLVLSADDSEDIKKKIAEKYEIAPDQIDSWKEHYLHENWCALTDGGFPFCL
ncbi:hypothetical protein [Streptomyces antimicrobicus]|uniref:Lipoprotein n=1 Tax=Streptomyces antimicrobicus TaxID=2883108 RepID=A0ABS8BBP3_9ACTN|nr:hypothetical protein [Streptomyces antimicrobicus]MCB5181968.1 hypothetical protein [Streptomyces antimicrobicus]